MPVVSEKKVQVQTPSKGILKVADSMVVDTTRGRVTVDTNRPMPEELPKWHCYPFGSLEPGYSFSLPYKAGRSQQVRAAAWQWCNYHGIPYCFRALVVREHGTLYVRCWRLGDPAPSPEPAVAVDGPVNL